MYRRSGFESRFTNPINQFLSFFFFPFFFFYAVFKSKVAFRIMSLQVLRVVTLLTINIYGCVQRRVRIFFRSWMILYLTANKMAKEEIYQERKGKVTKEIERKRTILFRWTFKYQLTAQNTSKTKMSQKITKFES